VRIGKHATTGTAEQRQVFRGVIWPVAAVLFDSPQLDISIEPSLPRRVALGRRGIYLVCAQLRARGGPARLCKIWTNDVAANRPRRAAVIATALQ
jgi:hypothetical protein